MIVIGGEALVDLVDDDGSPRPMAGGGPFNTAIALGRLEVPVGFLGSISRDAYGQMLAEQLVDSGVDTSLVRRSDAPTARALVHRERDGGAEYSFEVLGTSLADLSIRDLPVLPDDAWAVHVGTLALAVDPPAAVSEQNQPSNTRNTCASSSGAALRGGFALDLNLTEAEAAAAAVSAADWAATPLFNAEAKE